MSRNRYYDRIDEDDDHYRSRSNHRSRPVRQPRRRDRYDYYEDDDDDDDDDDEYDYYDDDDPRYQQVTDSK